MFYLWFLENANVTLSIVNIATFALRLRREHRHCSKRFHYESDSHVAIRQFAMSRVKQPFYWQQIANIQVESFLYLLSSYSLRKPPHSTASKPCWQTDATWSSESQWLHNGVPDGRRWRLRKRTAEWGVKPKRHLRCVCGWSSGRYMGHHTLKWLTASVMKVWHCWIVLFCTDIAHWLRYATLFFCSCFRGIGVSLYLLPGSGSINNYTLTLTNLIFLTVASIILCVTPLSLILTCGSECCNAKSDIPNHICLNVSESDSWALIRMTLLH